MKTCIHSSAFKYTANSVAGRCVLFLIGLILAIQPRPAKAQTIPGYDEIFITCNVERIGSVELPALIYKDQCYLPVKELFDFLKIKTQFSNTGDSITGFFIQPEARYVVDKPNNSITYRQNITSIPEYELQSIDGNIFLKLLHFTNIFGLDCQFNFRSLSVNVSAKFELPAIKEMQFELMRRNMIKLKGEKKADTLIGRSFTGFHLGMADWSFMSNQQSGYKASTRANLSLGANVAGGEADVYLNYNSQESMTRTRQFYKWRYVDNNNAVVKQVTAGKIFAQSTSSLFAPVIGVQLNNTPTTYRRSFGSYILSNTTEPGWMVELYVNNILVNYMQADASGFYSFEVPLVYGNSMVKLRFFGPWGEERTREENIVVPFNFLPHRQFEYNVTAGMVNDNEKGAFSRVVANYGLSARVTIGGGLEYLSTLRANRAMPFLNASIRLASTLLFSAEHINGVLDKAILTYRFPSNLQIETNFTRYVKGQEAIRVNYIDEKKMMLSMPYKHKRLALFSRFTLSRVTIPKNTFTSSELLLSANYKGISSNITTYAWISNANNIFIYSNLSLTFRVKSGMRITPQVQYDYSTKKLGIIKCEVEKRLFANGFINASYEHNSRNRTNFSSLGIRYNFSFAQTSLSLQQTNKVASMVQMAKGSLMYNDVTHKATANNQSSIGKGGILIKAFLDVNCNGSRDKDEPMLNNINIHVNGGKLQMNRDTSIAISNLEAYNNYLIELDNNSFENVAWQLKKRNINVAIDPNRFKLVEVPVSVVGEVAGYIFLNKSGGNIGLSRVIVNIINSKGEVVGKTLSESDGYFSYMGLVPGTYTAQVDNGQLQKLEMKTQASNSTTFVIRENREGDVVDGLEFVLQSIPLKLN